MCSPPYFVEAVLCLAATMLWYVYSYLRFNYWKKLGVRQKPVELPFVGDLVKIITTPAAVREQQTYYAFSNERYFGTYNARTPVLYLRDPDLIESILIKDFSYFHNRGITGSPKRRLGKHLLNLKDDAWKSFRSKLTPTFSSGKLKGIHSTLIERGECLMQCMKNLEDGRPIEIRDLISRFTMDVTASCAFGLNFDIINNPECEFRKIGLKLLSPSIFLTLLLKLPHSVRALAEKIKLTFPSPELIDYFENVLDEAIELRTKNNVVRVDFLHLMNELRLKDEDMIANNQLDPNDPNIFDRSALHSNAFVFFLAGFETTAATISYAMYELALNIDIQDEVYKEVSSVLRKHGGTPSFDACQEMALLECVIKETLRKYPPFLAVDRATTQEYTVPGTDLTLPVGSIVKIPIHALHHDPQYFPEPEKFMPSRFLESKNTIRKGTYLPFGAGPRSCIAGRLGKLQAKLCLAMMISNYEIIRCSKTVIPLKFARCVQVSTPEGGLWVAIRPRRKSAQQD